MQIVLPCTAFILISNVCECISPDCQMQIPKLIVNILNPYLGTRLFIDRLLMHFRTADAPSTAWNQEPLSVSLWIDISYTNICVLTF